MTVNELIEALNHYPGDMRVLVPGYERGYDDAGLKTDNIVFNYNNKDTWYYGPHESVGMVESHVDDLNTLSGHKYNKFVQDEKCLIVWRGK